MQAERKVPAWLLCRVDPVEFLFRIVFGGVFCIAGAIKMTDLLAFEAAIRNYRLLADPFVAWAAMSIPPLEFIAGSAVILRVIYPGCIIVLCGSLTIFMGALISLLVRGIDADCGCLGISTTIEAQLAIDCLLATLGGLLFWMSRKNPA
jgi:hypothetical protein